jgi:hypothetical protein
MKGVAMPLLFIAAATAAQAGPCTEEIAALRSTLKGQEARGGAVGSAPQSLGAQLERQPTPASVESAKKAARTKVDEALARAETLDAEGKQAECQEAVATAKRTLAP